MDLFDFNNYEETAKPLSERMRANTLNEFIGQKHLVAEGSLLRRAIASDRLGSCIFWGPPGCGKTTLANIIAMTTNGEFIKLNAVIRGVADVKKAVVPRAKSAHVRQAHLSDAGRMPPFQQNAERFAAARHRKGHDYFYRFHYRKSVRFDDARHRFPLSRV